MTQPVANAAPIPQSNAPARPRSFNEIGLVEKIRYILSKAPIPQLAYKLNNWDPTWIEHQNTEAFRNTKVLGIRKLSAMRLAVFTVAAAILVSAVILTLPYIIGAGFILGSVAISTAMLLTMLSEALVIGLYHLSFLTKPSTEQKFSFTNSAIELAKRTVGQTRVDSPFAAHERGRQRAEPAPGEKAEELPPQREVEETRFEHPDAHSNQQTRALTEAHTLSESEKFRWDTIQLCNETIRKTKDYTPDKLNTAIEPLKNPESTQIDVVQATSFQVTQHLKQSGLRPAVLNMAHPRKPGLGQEGMLCTQSNLHEALTKANQEGLYPIDEFGVVFAPNVTFFKNDQGEKIDHPFNADVISAAAYDCRQGGNNFESGEAYEAGVDRKIKAILRAAVLNGNDALVLGAFGCDSFENTPAFISSKFNETLALEEFQGRFKAVFFAIPEEEGSQNLATFRETFPPIQPEENPSE